MNIKLNTNINSCYGCIYYLEWYTDYGCSNECLLTREMYFPSNGCENKIEKCQYITIEKLEDIIAKSHINKNIIEVFEYDEIQQ